MGAENVVEITQPGRTAQRLAVPPGRTEVGRQCDGIELADPSVSRRHFALVGYAEGLGVLDLGSTYGTTVNGVMLEGERALSAGDVVRAGATTLTVVETAQSDRPRRAPVPARPLPPPAPTELVEEDTDAALLRYRRASAGEAAAPAMAVALKRARKRLAGLGSEPWGVKPRVALVDPLPDPSAPGGFLTSGSVVDATTGEIWMVVTTEAPPEPPERALALFFGASLPAGAELDHLLEGYGLHLAGLPSPDSTLRGTPFGQFESVDGEQRAQMSLSFVRYLLDRAGDASMRRLFAEARPGRLDAAATEIYGRSLSLLEQSWRQGLEGEEPPVRTARFLRVTLRYLRPHLRAQGEMVVWMVFGLAFTAVFPFAYRELIDHAIPGESFSRIATVLGVMLGAFVVSLLAELRLAYVSARVSGAMVRELRVEIFGRVQQMSARWFGRHQQGDVTARLFTDVAAFEEGLDETMREGLSTLLSLAVAGTVAMLIHPLLGIILIAASPVVAITYQAMGGGAKRRSSAVQEQTGQLMAIASENYQAQAVVKSFGLEGTEQGRFARACDRLFRASVRRELYSGLFGSVVGGLVLLLRIAVLGVGAWLIVNGHLTVGGLVAFLGVESQVLYPVRALTTIGQRVQAASGALVRIDEILHEQPEIADATDAVELPLLSHEITLRGASLSYTSERRALFGLDVVIPAGARVAFVGPTGAGKSSVLQLITRTYDPDEGAVLFDGRDLRTVTVASLRAQIGVVQQESFLFDATIRDNIAMGRPGATDAEIEAAARLAELHDVVTKMPRGYATAVGERGAGLSGGQRQRLAIARALIRDPRILVLDEATSALDPHTERLIGATLDRVAAGRTVIAVTHRLMSIRHFDKIFVLADGRLAEQGTHDELIAADGLYASLWHEQTGGAPVAVEAPFDAAAALARVPLFAGLTAAELATIVPRLRAVDVAAGETVPERPGDLFIVRAGQCKLLLPGRGRELVPAASLGGGDAFGVSALLGSPTDGALRAVTPATLLVLDASALAIVAATLPAVEAAWRGTAAGPALPAPDARRITRITQTIAARPGTALLERA